MKLTRKMEDVITAILELENQQKVVRVRDLEKFFGIKTSSVIDSIKTLIKKGLVIHEKYGYVELTDEGVAQAKKVSKKRNILKEFFLHVLSLDNNTAEKEACSFEHYIKKETLKHIEIMTLFFSNYKINNKYVKDVFLSYVSTKDKLLKNKTQKLSKLIPGESGLIKSLTAVDSKKKAFNELGFKVGNTIKIVNISPLGDPLEVLVDNKTYSITKSDANLIQVQKKL